MSDASWSYYFLFCHMFFGMILTNRSDLSMRSGLSQLRRRRFTGCVGGGAWYPNHAPFPAYPVNSACGAIGGGGGPLRPPARARGNNRVPFLTGVFINTITPWIWDAAVGPHRTVTCSPCPVPWLQQGDRTALSPALPVSVPMPVRDRRSHKLPKTRPMEPDRHPFPIVLPFAKRGCC